MIVSCPTCGTLYRHSGEPGAAARCSCCAGTVHLAQRRSYAVLPVAEARARAFAASAPGLAALGASPPRSSRAAIVVDRRIGMDDPSLAPALTRTALDDAREGTPLTWAVVAPEPDSVAAFPDEPYVGEFEKNPVEADPSVDAPDPVPPEPRTRSEVVRGAAFGLVFGSASGLAGSWATGGPAIEWWCGGAAIGAMLGGWIANRWASPRA